MKLQQHKSRNHYLRIVLIVAEVFWKYLSEIIFIIPQRESVFIADLKPLNIVCISCFILYKYLKIEMIAKLSLCHPLKQIEKKSCKETRKHIFKA